MEFEVTEAPCEINFSPQTKAEEILQNVRTIISTPKYSVPLARDFGVETTMIDGSLLVVQARLTAEVIAAIHKWEPRARVTEVTFDESNAQDGVLRPRVKVRIE